jgi:tetratricopeptide (TPR) repeat protein
MRCYSRGLKLKPNDVDAKIMLASCFVEGTQNPMDGITMLREVEKTDSNNVKLQLSFAFFSVKSGQLDRAIERFKKVLRIDSTYIEAYLHLADAYEQQGNTALTIRALEKYGEKTTDPTARIEIGKYIQQLKSVK